MINVYPFYRTDDLGWQYTHLHAHWRDRVSSFIAISAELRLRGYGASSKPPGDSHHQTYAKRASAQDQVSVMSSLGFDRFFIAGHDRGGRVGHRMALDYPEKIAKLALLDIVPTWKVYEKMNILSLAQRYYHWFFLIQPNGIPEHLVLIRLFISNIRWISDIKQV